MTLVYYINCIRINKIKSLITVSQIPPPIYSAADWFPLAMIDGSLRSPKQTRVWCVSGMRPIRVWSASSLRSLSSCECLLRACPVFALRPPSVHTEVSVHSVSTLRSRRVHPASTLCLRCVHFDFLESERH